MLAQIATVVLAGVGVASGIMGERIRRQSLADAPDVWLYAAAPIIPVVGPWKALVSHKGAQNQAMPEEGWSFAEIPDTFIARSGAEAAAIQYIKERGGTPERFGEAN